MKNYIGTKNVDEKYLENKKCNFIVQGLKTKFYIFTGTVNLINPKNIYM